MCHAFYKVDVEPKAHPCVMAYAITSQCCLLCLICTTFAMPLSVRIELTIAPTAWIGGHWKPCGFRGGYDPSANGASPALEMLGKDWSAWSDPLIPCRIFLVSLITHGLAASLSYVVYEMHHAIGTIHLSIG